MTGLSIENKWLVMRRSRGVKKNCEREPVVSFESKLGHFYVSRHPRGSAKWEGMILLDVCWIGVLYKSENVGYVG